MKRLLMLFPLVLLCCLGCQQDERVLVEPKADVEADIQVIKNMVADYNAAVNAVDIDKCLSIFADDAVMVSPNESPAIGKEAIRGTFQQIFNVVALQDDYVVDDVNISGNLAIAYISWSSIITLKSTEENFDAKGKGIWVLKKQPDGSWIRTYSIYSDERLIYPEQVE